MEEVRFYMKGSKILNQNGNLLYRIKRNGLLSKEFLMVDAEDNYIFSIFIDEYGFLISETQDRDDPVFIATRDKSFQIGLGPRFLSKPVIPLVELPFGAYTGACEYGSIVIKGKNFYLDNNLYAACKIRKSLPSEVISTFTHRLNYVRMSGKLDLRLAQWFIASFAYLFYLKEKFIL